MKKQNKSFGFTMIELLVVATIIAVLSAIGVVSFSRANIKARDGKRKADLEQVRAALELYRSDIGYYPLYGNSASDWTNMVSALSTAGYLSSSSILDPKNDGTTYYYRYCASTTKGGACVTAGTPKYYYVQAMKCENASDPQCSGGSYIYYSP